MDSLDADAVPQTVHVHMQGQSREVGISVYIVYLVAIKYAVQYLGSIAETGGFVTSNELDEVSAVIVRVDLIEEVSERRALYDQARQNLVRLRTMYEIRIGSDNVLQVRGQTI